MESKCWWRQMVVVMVVMRFGWSVAGYELTILHTNDVHARFDQTNSRSGQCPVDYVEGDCYGGFPRLFKKVQEIRSSYDNVVFVDAGDQFQGTLWFYTYGGNITTYFMNRMSYDIMALGNHEFDLGPSEVAKLVRTATFPILSANTDASAYPDIASRLNGSYVLEVGGQRIGFVGYTTVETVNISQPENIRFTDEVEAVRREVERLTSQGVNKIICVGHAGFTKDLHIAREVVGVDVVVGGHTNTFLYTGPKPSDEIPVGRYPEVVERQDGSKALVVQDYAFGKYLGFLQVTFDDMGEVSSWKGNPILLDKSVVRDDGLLADLLRWKEGVTLLSNKILGRTAVLLMGHRSVCRQRECNLGNVITDGMVMQNLRHSDGAAWNHVSIALLNSGGIRASLEKGDITLADVLLVQPFRSTIDIIEVNGTALRAIMEHSASEWSPQLKGGFLQHSGLHVIYDMDRPVGSRVVELQVKCTDCDIPHFEDVEASKVYKVIVPSFLAGGGDGYKVITDNTLKRHLNGDLDSDVLAEYISKFSPLVQGLEGRIRFANETRGCGTSGTVPTAFHTSLSLLITTIAALAAAWLDLL